MGKKTSNVMNIECKGIWLKCVYHYDVQTNPYYLYQIWWVDGMHKRLLAKLPDFKSVLLACASIEQFKD